MSKLNSVFSLRGNPRHTRRWIGAVVLVALLPSLGLVLLTPPSSASAEVSVSVTSGPITTAAGIVHLEGTGLLPDMTVGAAQCLRMANAPGYDACGSAQQGWEGTTNGDGSLSVDVPVEFYLQGGNYCVSTQVAPNISSCNLDLFYTSTFASAATVEIVFDVDPNLGPTAVLSVRPTGTPGSVIADGSASHPGAAVIIGYTVADGTGLIWNTLADGTRQLDYPHAGTYTITLTVTTADGRTNATSTDVTVEDPPPPPPVGPIPGATAALHPIDGLAGDRVQVAPSMGRAFVETLTQLTEVDLTTKATVRTIDLTAPALSSTIRLPDATGAALYWVDPLAFSVARSDPATGLPTDTVMLQGLQQSERIDAAVVDVQHNRVHAVVSGTFGSQRYNVYDLSSGAEIAVVAIPVGQSSLGLVVDPATGTAVVSLTDFTLRVYEDGVEVRSTPTPDWLQGLLADPRGGAAYAFGYGYTSTETYRFDIATGTLVSTAYGTYTGYKQLAIDPVHNRLHVVAIDFGQGQGDLVATTLDATTLEERDVTVLVAASSGQGALASVTDALGNAWIAFGSAGLTSTFRPADQTGNTPPTAIDQAVSTTEDESVSFVVTATDPDPDQTLSFLVTSSPVHGVVTGAAPNLTFVPEAGFSGRDSFTFRASDGLASSAEATVTIEVAGVNQAPVVNAPQLVVAGPTTFTLDVTDPDVGDPAPEVSILVDAAHGDVAVAGLQISYAPDSGYSGPDSFQLRVSDRRGGITDVPVAVTVGPHFSTSFDTALDSASLLQSGLRWCGSPITGRWIDPTITKCSNQNSAVATASTAGGALLFPQVGWTLPYVRTAPGLVPSTGDIVIDAEITVSTPAVSVYSRMGWTVRSGADLEPRPGGTNSPFASAGPSCSAFELTAENGGPVKASIVAGRSISVAATPATHLYRLQYVNGRLSLFIDGELALGPVLTPYRPTAAWFGSPWFWNRMGTMRLQSLAISSPSAVDSDAFGGYDGTQYFNPVGGLGPSAMTDADHDGLADLCEGASTSPAVVTIEQVTDPVFVTPAFTYFGNTAGVLHHGDDLVTSVTPGDVVIRQAPTTGWPLTGVDCGGREMLVDLVGGEATVRAAQGERIYCRFTNGPGNVQGELPPGWASTLERVCPFTLETGRWVPTGQVTCGGDLEEPPAAPPMVDGAFALSTGDTFRRTFPFIYTVPGVVPTESDNTVVDMTVRFPTIRSFDAMVRIAAHGDPTPVGTNMPWAYGAEECASPEVVDGVLQLPGASPYIPAVRPAVTLPDPAAPHHVRMQWSSGWMFVFLDGQLAIGPIRTDIRPDTIDLGNPRFMEFGATALTAFSEITVGDIVITTPATVDHDNNGADDGSQDWSHAPVVPSGFEAMRNDTDGDGVSDLCDERPTTSDVGTLVVEKQTVEQGDPTEFSFSGPVNGPLSDDERSTRLLAPGQWIIGERPQTGWAVVKIVCDGREVLRSSDGTVRVGVSANRTTTCVFTNDRTGTLRIVKQTDVDPGDQQFTFVGSIYAVIKGVGTWETPVWPGHHRVNEVAAPGWELDDLTCVDPTGNTTWTLASGSVDYDIARGETVTCTFVNRKVVGPVGYLEIEKLTDPADRTALFTFTGSRSASLRHTDVARFAVAPGTYTINEAAQVGWTLQNIVCTDSDSSGNVELARAVYRIDADETVRCTFTNRRMSRLVIVKETTPDLSPVLFTVAGDVSATLRDGTSRAFTVPADTPIDFHEANLPPGWALGSVDCPGGVGLAVDLPVAAVTVTVPDQATVVCTLRNEYVPASVTIVKVTEPETASASFGFGGFPGPFTLTGAAPGNERTFTMTQATGQVVESPTAGWHLVAIDCGDHPSVVVDLVGSRVSITAQPHDVIRCTFTNRRDAETGTIEIEKQTKPDGDPTVFEFTGMPGDRFLSDDEVVSFTVPTGVHAVRELAPAGWVLADLVCDDPSDAAVSTGSNTIVDVPSATAVIDLAKDETVHCTFTNHELARITIVKTTQPESPSAVFGFSGFLGAFTLSGAAPGNTVSFRTLSSGAVTERPTIGWTLIAIDCGEHPSTSIDVAAATVTMVVQPGDDITCTFVNRRDTGTIEIEKQVLPGTDPTRFHFTGITIPDLGDDDVATVVVPTGVYQVTEQVPSQWHLTGLVCTDPTGDTTWTLADATAHVVLSKDETIHCTYENSKLGSLVIVKEIPLPSGGPQFDFSVAPTPGLPTAFTLAGGESRTFSLLGSGTASEVAPLPAGWRRVAGPNGVECTDPSNDTTENDVTATWAVSPGETVTCVFRNEPIPGTLILEKQTTPDLPTGTGPAFQFTIDGATGPALRDDERSTAIALAAGSHSITELPQAGWSFTAATCQVGTGAPVRIASNPFTATIVSGVTTTCVVDNLQPPSLKVTKEQRNVTMSDLAFTSGVLNGVALGDTIEYRLTVTNTGGSPLAGVQLVDTLDPNMRWTSAPGCTAVGLNVTCTLPVQLAVGDSRVFLLRARVHFECVVVGTRFDDDLSVTGVSADAVAAQRRGPIVRGTDSGETVCGAGGSDTIRGNGGDDFVYGDAPSNHAGLTVRNEVTATATGVADRTAAVSAVLVHVPDAGDTMTGDAGADQMWGQAGGDTVTGGTENDTMWGDDGAVPMPGAPGDDTISGQDGGDTIYGQDGGDTLDGNDGPDTISGNGGSDTIRGGAGEDTITGNENADTIDGGSGGDTIGGGLGNDVITGDTSAASTGGKDTIHGDDGGDRISGFDGADILFGDGDDDTIAGGDAGDTIDGGQGSDTITGQIGNDTIRGGTEVDTIGGGDGNDTINGDEAGDTVHGDVGDDTIGGDGGNDTLFGDEGFDLITGDAGDDVMYGQSENDILSGGLGDDDLFGGEGSDQLLGGDGSDRLAGDVGTSYASTVGSPDQLSGGAGNDLLLGQGGDDGCAGTTRASCEGSGARSLIFSAGPTPRTRVGPELEGGLDVDRIHGGAGNDRLDGGGSVNNILVGGTGTNYCSNGILDIPGRDRGDIRDTTCRWPAVGFSEMAEFVNGSWTFTPYVINVPVVFDWNTFRSP